MLTFSAWGGGRSITDLGGQARQQMQKAMVSSKQPDGKDFRALAASHLEACHVNTLAAKLPGCLAAWLPGCLAAWLPGCLAAWLPGPRGWLGQAGATFAAWHGEDHGRIGARGNLRGGGGRRSVRRGMAFVWQRCFSG